MNTAAIQYKIEFAIKRLKQGLLTNEYVLIATAWKSLLDESNAAVLPLVAELKKIDVCKIEDTREIALVTGLVAILHDLSESAAEEFIVKSLSTKCVPALEINLKSIARHRQSDYRDARINDTPILEHKGINQEYRATAHVLKWLETVPAAHIENLSKIYLIPAEEWHDFHGYYRPYLNIITLSWRTDYHPRNPVNSILNIDRERTLYHEIGHHRFKHQETGQRPEQEEQAERYAREMILKNHRWLAMLSNAVRALRSIFRVSVHR